MFGVTAFVMIKSLEDISIDICILFHIYATVKAYLKNIDHSLTFISRETDRSCAMSIVACPSIITDYITSFVTNIPSAIALKMFKLITFYPIKVQIKRHTDFLLLY